MAKDMMKERGRVMLKNVLKEAMVEAIEESDRYERKRPESAEGRSDGETTGRAESTESDQSSSSKLPWIVPVGIGLVAVYLWRRRMSGEEGVQKSITEWKNDDESSEDGGESALSEDEDAGYGTTGEAGMEAPEGVDTDESGRTDAGSGEGDGDDETAETTETA